jgi:hypothetical protein
MIQPEPVIVKLGPATINPGPVMVQLEPATLELELAMENPGPAIVNLRPAKALQLLTADV